MRGLAAGLLLPAALVLTLLPVDAGAAGKHRRYSRPPEAEEPEEKPEVDYLPEDLAPLRYPLVMAWGESGSREGSSVPSPGAVLSLMDAAPFRVLDPWNRWPEDFILEARSGKRGPDRDRLDLRMAYLARKRALADELCTVAGDISAMADSLVAAGEWSPAERAEAGLRMHILRQYRDDLEAILRHASAASPGKTDPSFPLPRQHLEGAAPEGASERALALRQEAATIEARLARYEEEILPSLEAATSAARQAHAAGEIGLALTVRRRVTLLQARAEYLSLLWRLNHLVQTLEAKS